MPCLDRAPCWLAALVLLGCGDVGAPGGAAGGPCADDPALLDADGDTIADRDEGVGDVDGDGVPNPLDVDSDGDGLPDAVEAGRDALCGTPPIDTDGDGTPDFLDLDSDGDGILDLHEGDLDLDGDGLPNFRDLDSDGDGASDRGEAGDDDPLTVPVWCPEELRRRWFPGVDPLPPEYSPDGLFDFVDDDSDNDGVPDREERERGTATCGWDTDGDGVGDVLELLLDRAAGDPDRGCALDPACQADPRLLVASLHFDRPRVGPSPRADLAAVTLDVPADLAGRVDVHVRVVDDPVTNAGFDATDLVRGVAPSCAYDPVEGVRPDAPCWDPPEGVAAWDAVEAIDGSTFFGVAPGTRLRFDLALEAYRPWELHGYAPGLRVRVTLTDGARTLDERSLVFLVWSIPVNIPD